MQEAGSDGFGPDPADPSGPYARFLRRLPLFEDLADHDLQRLCSSAEPVAVPAGEILMREGDAGDGLYVILQGELEVTRREGGREIVLGMRAAGEVVGEKSLLEGSPRSATIHAHTDASLLRIGPDAFRHLLAASPRASITIIRTLTGRLRSTEALLMSRAKLASLGTLAAGLAHELNNPAAAIRRSANILAERLRDLRQSTKELLALELSPSQTTALAALAEAEPSVGAPASSPVERAAAEDHISEWLENRGVDDPWSAAPTLLAFAVDEPQLDSLAAQLGAAFPSAIRWIATALDTRLLVDESARSAQRISAIVTAVKTYTFMDRAPVQDVDVNACIDDTLRILEYRTRTGFEIATDYDPDLPSVEAYGGELNQVWTNLIDNALDAMPDGGRLVITTRAAGDSVVVTIEDNGSGIAPELQKRIFDPFFTTKEPGRGSGLGLHVAHNIVVEKHGGRIDVESGEGGTRFRVTLPRRLRKGPAQPGRNS